MQGPVRDIFNLEYIYNNADGFEYSLPRPVLESFISGKAFDNKTPYTADEASRLREDITDLFQKTLAANPEKTKVAIITAGAPGSGKTVYLHRYMDESLASGVNLAYVCPDDVCLPSQTRTYVAMVAATGESKESRQAAYNKWRPGSNAATHLILANLIRDGYGFYFGSTSSGPATWTFFDFLKKQGYHIKLLHLTAPDEVRWGSIMERDKTFVQTTEQDIREKGLLLPRQIKDTFLAYADEIDFCYRGKVDERSELAARWHRNARDAQATGTLSIVSRDLYESIKRVHDEAVAVLKRFDLRWDVSVEQHSEVVLLSP